MRLVGPDHCFASICGSHRSFFWRQIHTFSIWLRIYFVQAWSDGPVYLPDVYLPVPSLELQAYLSFILIVGSETALIAGSLAEVFCNMHFVCIIVLPNQSVPFDCHCLKIMIKLSRRQLTEWFVWWCILKTWGNYYLFVYKILPINFLYSFARRTFDLFLNLAVWVVIHKTLFFCYCQCMHLLARV
jgi:hypothetical protein